MNETIAFAACLRLGNQYIHDVDIQEHTDRLVQTFGLQACEHTKVGGVDSGGPSVAGISGGERRRLAIACELVGRGTKAQSRVVILDEPTSGLDAFQAQTVIDKLQQLAHTMGDAVVTTIHQPRSSSFLMFDSFCLLSRGGRVCYSGRRDDVRKKLKA